MENILEEVKREQGVIVFRKTLCVEENKIGSVERNDLGEESGFPSDGL